MNLVIMDLDCAYNYTPEKISKLLGGGDVKIYQLDGIKLDDKNMRFERLFGLPENAKVDKAVFITYMSSGLMRYQTSLLKDNPNVSFWVISIVDVENTVYREQFLNRYDAELNGKNIRYEIIFDKSSEAFCETAKTLNREIPLERTCLVVSAGDLEYTQSIAEIVKRKKPDWSVITNPEDLQTMYKYADKILIVGRTPEDFLVTPVSYRTDRVYLWVEKTIGANKDELTELIYDIQESMESSGWRLSKYKDKTLCVIPAYEKILCDIIDGEIGIEALATLDDFVMWDVHGLPALVSEYTDYEKAEAFLNEQCCLGNMFK